MASVTIRTHWRWFVRCSLWLVCIRVCTAVVGLYAGARWAALSPALWLAIFVPMVLLPIIKTDRKD